MSSESVPLPGPSTNLGTSSLSSNASSLPFWDRLSLWASENKAVVYTITGVAVVASGAGVAYYLSDSRKESKEAAAEDKKRLSKKERRKAKQEKEKDKSTPEAGAAREKPKEQRKLVINGNCALQNFNTLQAQAKPSTVETDPLEDVPRIDENNVDSLSEQV